MHIAAYLNHQTPPQKMGFMTNRALSLLTFSLLLQLTLSTDPLHTICSTSKTFPASSPFQRTLTNLLGDLHFKTPPTGFGLASSGHLPDRAFALSLCRGDVPASDCAACVADAGSAVTSRCPSSREAAVWYDRCYLKYSDSDFFGKIDGSKFYLVNVRNVSSSAEEFGRRTRDLLTELSENASGGRLMFAGGEAEIGEKKIYGMVQCSRDLLKEDCRKCLEDAVGELPWCCGGKEGGRVVGGSCNVRYEVYPFLNV